MPGTERLPFFLDRHGRRLFCIAYSPRDRSDLLPAVVFFAPFGEEMNRSRRMATLLGEALAIKGIGFVVFDYHGTGDSDGDFSDARWEHWIEDGLGAIEWTADRFGGPVTVVGLRLGAGLALGSAERCQNRVDRAVLWQPVVSGALFLTQMLRLRIASALAGESGKENTAGLRERLGNGESLEIAGYTLTPQLATAIEKFRLADHRMSKPVDWFEVGSAGADVAPASGAVIEDWRSAGAFVREMVIPGDLFWATQEITVAPFLISETLARLTGSAQ